MQSLSFNQIFNLLYEGKTLTLPFPDKPTAESFRVRLSHQKLREERRVAKIGMELGTECLSLRFSYVAEKQTATIALVKRKPLTTYDILEISEDGTDGTSS